MTETNRFKELRKELGLSQRELGERANMAVTIISDMERGQRPLPPPEKIAVMFRGAEVTPLFQLMTYALSTRKTEGYDEAKPHEVRLAALAYASFHGASFNDDAHLDVVEDFKRQSEACDPSDADT